MTGHAPNPRLQCKQCDGANGTPYLVCKKCRDESLAMNQLRARYRRCLSDVRDMHVELATCSLPLITKLELIKAQLTIDRWETENDPRIRHMTAWRDTSNGAGSMMRMVPGYAVQDGFGTFTEEWAYGIFAKHEEALGKAIAEIKGTK
jgi:hypothetical protein